MIRAFTPVLLLCTAIHSLVSFGNAQDDLPYVDGRNETVNIQLTQAFFNNLSENFTTPLLALLQNVSLGPVNITDAPLLGMTISANLSDIGLQNSTVDGTVPLV
jgi:hypothetical protein